VIRLEPKICDENPEIVALFVKPPTAKMFRAMRDAAKTRLLCRSHLFAYVRSSSSGISGGASVRLDERRAISLEEVTV